MTLAMLMEEQRREGYAEGFAIGYAEGKAEIEAQVKDKVKTEVLDNGCDKESLELLVNMVIGEILTIKEAAEYAGFSEEVFKQQAML